jgi:hypothetical protein
LLLAPLPQVQLLQLLLLQAQQQLAWLLLWWALQAVPLYPLGQLPLRLVRLLEVDPHRQLSYCWSQLLLSWVRQLWRFGLRWGLLVRQVGLKQWR